MIAYSFSVAHFLLLLRVARLLLTLSNMLSSSSSVSALEHKLSSQSVSDGNHLIGMIN